MNVEALALLPAWSAAVQDTVVVPRGKVLPEAGAHVTVGEAVTASVALGVNLTAAPALDVASTVTPAGTVSCGAVVSTAGSSTVHH